MSNEIEKKTELKEPVNTKDGVFLDNDLHKLHKVSENLNSLQLEIGYNILNSNSISKSLRYSVESKTENVKRLAKRNERESTKINKKIWLETYEKKGAGSFILTCKATAIPTRTFYYWLENDSQFSSSIEEIKKNNIKEIRDVLLVKAKGGNMSAVKFWLENNDPVYSKKIKVETYTGDKTLEDLLDEDEDNLNNENGGEKKKEEESIGITPGVDEDKKQEGEDSPISA